MSYRLILIFIFTTLYFSYNSVCIANKSLSPESGIAQINDELRTISFEIDTVKRLNDGKNHRINLVEANNILAKAKDFYAREIYWAALNWYAKYLNTIQVPSPMVYIEIKRDLFFIYTHLRLYEQAMYHANQYISTFQTIPKKNYDDLKKMIQEITKWKYHNTILRKEIKSFITSIAAINFPIDFRYEMLVHNAKLAKQSGKEQLASQWLANAALLTDVADVKVRAKFFKGIIAVRLSKWSNAIHIFDEVLEDSDIEDDLKNYTNLALARLHFHLGKIDLAIEYYENIDSENYLYVEALHELIYAYAKKEEWNESRSYAIKFLSSYPENPHAFRIEEMMPYLEIQSGHYKEAETILKNSLKNIGKLEKKISASRGDEFSILTKMVDKHILQPPLTKRIHFVDQKISKLNQTMSSLNSSLLRSIISIGDIPIVKLKPELSNYFVQMTKIGRKLLAVGHEIIQFEKNLYKDYLSIADQALLDSLLQQRESLVSIKGEYSRRYQPFRTQKYFWSTAGQISELWDKIGILKGKMAALKFRLKSSDEAGQDLEKVKLHSLEKKINKKGELLAEYLEEHRRLKLEDQKYQLKSFPEKVILDKYSLLIQEEAEHLKNYREKYSSGHGRMLSGESARVWEIWNLLMGKIYKTLNSIEKRLSVSIQKEINFFKSQKNLYKKIKMQAEDLAQEFVKIKQDSMPYLVDHYKYQLLQRVARNQKWINDIKWLEFEGESKNERKKKGLFEKNKIILEQNINQVKNGFLVTWPDIKF